MKDNIKAQLTEDYLVEQPAIDWLKELGYSYSYGGDLSPENEERVSYKDVILKRRFKETIKRINPWLNDELCEQVYRKITDIDHPDFLMKGKLFYDMLTNGVKVTFREGNKETTRLVWLIDFDDPAKNDFLVANQFTVECLYAGGEHRRPDLVVFINGIPVAVFELKSLNADETARDAFNEHQAKKEAIPQLYVYAQILAVADGLETKYGSVTSDWEHFSVWEGIFSDDDLNIKEIEPGHYRYFYKDTGEEIPSLKVLLAGLFRQEHLLEFIQNFIIYERAYDTYEKKIAYYHQFYTVKKAIERTVRCVTTGTTPDERRIGVVWHTQGTGKSLTMLFYARMALKTKELANPLLLFITDRQNLDDQLSRVFAKDLVLSSRAQSIHHLQSLIKRTSFGVIFATIQKFGKRRSEEYPFLSDRKNVVVIADEAHRSQYRELAQNLRRAIPNASFMGFTATPIELADRDTYLVFGAPISVYSMDKARRHNIVVPIYYEARLANLHLTNEFIDLEFEELSEKVVDEPEAKEELKRRFARLERLILNEERLQKVADDIVEHFNNRREELAGKAMVVTISRKVAVELGKRISAHPQAPSVKVVISGNKTKDPEDFWPHIRSRTETDQLVLDFTNPEKDPQMVIVVDMWLTGSDFPCLHTMYFDKPMKNHSLVQAIARVNRVFKDKPGGLIVDYIGIADNLRKSLSIYTQENISQILTDIAGVIKQLREKYDIVSAYFTGIDYRNWQTLSKEALTNLTLSAYERICQSEETKKQFLKNFIALKKLYALASPHPETYAIKNDIRFFEMLKKMATRYSIVKGREIARELEYEISQLLSRSIAAEEPVDVLTLIGKERPDISVFDEEFLAEFKKMEYKNFAIELLAKILKDRLVARVRVNPFRYRSFYDMLKELIEKYNVRLIDTIDVLERLVQIARDYQKAAGEVKKLNLSEEELAFYDLLASQGKYFQNYDEIVQVAREVVKELGQFVRVADWNKKEYMKAKIRVALKNVLSKRIQEGIDYHAIDALSKELVNHAELIYTAGVKTPI